MNWLVWGIVLTFVLIVAGGFLLRSLRNGNRHFSRKTVRPSVTILLVVYNQEQIIEGVIRQLRWLNNWLPGSFDLIVVDNASQDRTAFILERLWRKHGDFSYYHLDSFLDPSALGEAHPWPFRPEQPGVYQLDLQGEAGLCRFKEIRQQVQHILMRSCQPV